MKLNDHVHSQDYEFNPEIFSDYLKLSPLKLANQVLVQHAEMLLLVKTVIFKEDDPGFRIYTLPIESKKQTTGVWTLNIDVIKTRILTGTITQLKVFFQSLQEEEVAKQPAEDEKSTKAIIDSAKKVYAFFNSLETSPTKLLDIVKMMNIVIITRMACNKPIEGLRVVEEVDLDTNLNYLGAPNGIIDLTTGELIRGHKAATLLITKKIRDPYDDEAEHPLANQLFAGIGLGAADYVKREFAFSLRGVPSKRMLFLTGPKDSGKSSLSSAYAAALGEYGGRLHPSVLASSKSNEDPTAASPYMFAITHPVRFAYGDERESESFDAARIKRFSSGGVVSIRQLYGGSVEKPVTATLANLANWLPESGLKLKDAAVRSRLRIIKCQEIPEEERNPYLDEARMSLSDHKDLRQALISYLVRLGVRQGEEKPVMPPRLVAYQEIIRREDLNEIGAWLMENIRIQEDGRIFIKEIMVALRKNFERIGREEIKIGAQSYSGVKISKEIKKIFELGEAATMKCLHNSIGGIKKGGQGKGWKGYVLDPIPNEDLEPEDQQEMDDF